MRRLFRYSLWCAPLLFAAIAMGTTVIPASVEKLTADSSDIIEARAIDAHSEWNADKTLIYTYTRFEVRRSLKGSATNVVTVKQMGGHAGGYSQKVSGVYHWKAGDEAVLFLRPSEAKDGTLVVTGLVQGNFRMMRMPSGQVEVTNGVPEVRAVDMQTKAAGVYTGSRMKLDELEQRVRKAVEQ